MIPGHNSPTVSDDLAYLRKGVAEIVPEDEFIARLERSAKTGKPLRVKLGVDPTAPDLHLGHTVVLRKLKHFQDRGHTAIFLVGDFTALVGDPTGQSETRPALTPAQVKENAQTYLEQVYKILDRKKTEVRYNSDWLGKLSSYDIVRLCGKYRLARMLEHEDFRSRLEANQPLSIHELLYPLLVAYDSVVLEADVELGATEQKFNLLMGREIQREFNKPQQAIITMPILVGLDGARKMSKSLGNQVGITEAPGEMFGKLMSISDENMWSYYELLTDIAPDVLQALRGSTQSGHGHPMIVKMELARRIVADFHGPDAAKHAMEEFSRVFRDRKAPSGGTEYFVPPSGKEKLARLLVYWAGLASKAEAERLIKQGAVELDGKVVKDPAYELELTAPREYELRVGKHKFFKVKVH